MLPYLATASRTVAEKKIAEKISLVDKSEPWSCYDQQDDEFFGKGFSKEQIKEAKKRRWRRNCVIVGVIILALALLLILTSRVRAAEQAVVTTVESEWTDQPQLIPEGLVGELHMPIKEEPYILYWQSDRGFREYIITNFPEEFKKTKAINNICGKDVIFTLSHGIVKSWGFADPSVCEWIDQYLRNFHKE